MGACTTAQSIRHTETLSGANTQALPAVPVRPLLWDCPQTESGPASAVSEPVALSPPVI